MIFLFDNTDQLGVNTIRTLSIEAVQKANSGHPGLPMGAAPMAYALWTKHLKVNPTTSTNWVDRDRFILSAGHGSAMLYSLLHLAGYGVTMDDLKTSVNGTVKHLDIRKCTIQMVLKRLLGL